MKRNNGALSDALKDLLDEKLPRVEVQSLKDEGFALKKPTRKDVLAIAIYKKAASGDLSAIKELRSILAGESDKSGGNKAVIIIDDIDS